MQTNAYSAVYSVLVDRAPSSLGFVGVYSSSLPLRKRPYGDAAWMRGRSR